MRERSAPELDHRLPLADSWTVWPWVWLRSAGFPADLVLRLATPRAAQAAATYVAREREWEAGIRRAIAVCEGALGDARGAEGPVLARVLKHLRAGTADPPAADLPSEVAEAASLARAAATRLAEARQELAALLGAEGTGARRAMQELFSNGPLREALLWQNRRLVHGSVGAFLRRPATDADSKMREYERVLATFLQRYCVKNDTIGYFGPVGWAHWSDSATGVSVRPGPGLVAQRTVYFEHWAVDALAARLAADPALRIHLAPRRAPTVRIEEEILHYPIERSAALPRPFARVLSLCDGETSARMIAALVLGEPEVGLSSEDEVMEVLDELAAKGFVIWTLELPTADPYPERTLRSLLERIPDQDARSIALEALTRLETARVSVARAAGDPAALDGAILALEATFTELTGYAPLRRAGQTYAGRGLVYEDCRRDVQLELGKDVREAIAEPLRLLLASARWYTYEIARRYRVMFQEAYDELRRETGRSVVALLRFKRRVDAHLAASQLEAPPIVKEVALELRTRWMRILHIADGERQVVRSARGLAPEVAAAFAAPHPGWPNARYQSPDLMIASDPAGVARGDCLFVLGELHTGMNSLLTHVALQQHPDPGDLVRAREIDRPEVAIAPVESKLHATRADNCAVARQDLHVEVGVTRSFRARTDVLAIADLALEDRGGRLVVRTLDDRRQFDVIAFFEQELTFASMGHFRVVGGRELTPRVTIDRMVVARERWRFEPQSLAFARGATTLERFVAARRWAEEHGVPRFVFARSPEEPKPVYIDLASSPFVDVLARWARKAPWLELSEMLPGHDQTWLTDAAGRRYTSELRIVAVDAEPWRPD